VPGVIEWRICYIYIYIYVHVEVSQPRPRELDKFPFVRAFICRGERVWTGIEAKSPIRELHWFTWKLIHVHVHCKAFLVRSW
jgi:hypothetical protein